MVIVSFDK